MKRVYCRCDRGHWFSGRACPLDGWTSEASDELVVAVNDLEDLGYEPSMEALRSMQVSEETLARALVIEFPDDPGITAVVPRGLLIRGKWRWLGDLRERPAPDDDQDL